MLTTLREVPLVVLTVAVIVLIATYLTWLASRLDRLAVRVTDARTGLTAQLALRVAAAGELVRQCELAELGEAVARARAAHAALAADGPLDNDAEAVENNLSRALRSAQVAATADRAPDALHAVDVAAARVALARQLHNDAVRDVRALRSRRIVRILRLSGRRPLPAYFEIDDALPVRSGGDGKIDGDVDEHKPDAGTLNGDMTGFAP
ncbi:hypothetical protein [Frankia sp. Cr1]|uniref:hypothetical protein n=1 Tax=Frankia sp. Cr1 TaxID=3073931 RepID=UPI002AD508B2|nr:hypothetical protein [Frankia sp. Cr1]